MTKKTIREILFEIADDQECFDRKITDMLEDFKCSSAAKKMAKDLTTNLDQSLTSLVLEVLSTRNQGVL